MLKLKRWHWIIIVLVIIILLIIVINSINRVTSNSTDKTREYKVSSNTSLRVINNELLKTSNLEFNIELSNDEKYFMDNFYDSIDTFSGKVKEVMTKSLCVSLQKIYFDYNYSKDSDKIFFPDSILELNSVDGNIFNPFSGYMIVSVKLNLKYESGEKISQCIITGKNLNQIEFKIY
ncbi:MAG: hypothetical protein WCX82_03940 [archaeon]|jgi:hypothetical protein